MELRFTTYGFLSLLGIGCSKVVFRSQTVYIFGIKNFFYVTFIVVCIKVCMSFGKAMRVSSEEMAKNASKIFFFVPF